MPRNINKQKKIILGIDPGVATTGFGIVEQIGSKLIYKDCGVIKTKPSIPLCKRLAEIEKDLTAIIKKYRPERVAVEQVYFAKNAKTAISVGHARGVIMLLCYKFIKNIVEVTPLQVKQAVTGYGQADKQQIQRMVKTILSLKKEPKPDDAADALAIAICCADNLKIEK